MFARGTQNLFFTLTKYLIIDTWFECVARQRFESLLLKLFWSKSKSNGLTQDIAQLLCHIFGNMFYLDKTQRLFLLHFLVNRQDQE